MKAFCDQEIQEVQLEANEFVEGWGEQIWPQAFHFHQVIFKIFLVTLHYAAVRLVTRIFT